MTKNRTKHGNIVTLGLNDDTIRKKIHDYRVKVGQDPDYIILHPDMVRLLKKEYKNPGQSGPYSGTYLYGIPVIIDTRRNSHEFNFYGRV